MLDCSMRPTSKRISFQAHVLSGFCHGSHCLVSNAVALNAVVSVTFSPWASSRRPADAGIRAGCGRRWRNRRCPPGHHRCKIRRAGPAASPGRSVRSVIAAADLDGRVNRARCRGHRYWWQARAVGRASGHGGLAAEAGSFAAEQWTFRVPLMDLGSVSHPAPIFAASPDSSAWSARRSPAAGYW